MIRHCTRLFLMLFLMAGVAACQRNEPQGITARVTATLAATFTPGGDGRAPAATETTPSRAANTPAPTATRAPSPTPDLSPAERLEAGLAAERLGNWEEAQGWYSTLRSDRSYGHAAMFYAGDLYFRTDLYVEAAAAWTLGVELDPDGEFAAPMLYRLGRGMAEIGQHESAIELFLRADELSDAADPVIAQRLAESYAAANEMEKAVAQWERLFEDPRTLRVNRALSAQDIGDWHAENERWLEAITWYQAALEGSLVESFRAGLMFKQGDFAREAGEIERARGYWQAVLDNYPTEDAALDAVAELEQVGRTFTPMELGELYLLHESYMQANDAFVAALEPPAHPAEGHAGLARAGEGNGNLAGAIEEWQKIIDTHPESDDLYPEAWYQMGRLQLELGAPTEAFAAWQTLLEQYPESSFAGSALFEWGNYSRDSDAMPDAIARWQQFAAEYPDHPRRVAALWALGMQQYRDADFESAEAAFAALAESEERATRGLFWAGKAALARGDSADAESFWEATIALKPADYYALRAADLLAEQEWSARGHARFAPPDRPFTVEGNGLPADEPFMAQGELLMLMGEQGWAYSSFMLAVTEQRANPAALWEMTQELHRMGAYNAQSEAARTLMSALDNTILDAPPTLLAYAYPLPYAEELWDATADFNEDPLFVAAMIYQESRWQARAVSSASARGLLQVIPETGRWIAVRLGDTDFAPRDLYRPLTALQYGTYYLDYCLDEFDDNPYHALAAYNGGPGNARRWAADDPDLFVERINFPETRSYIELVYTHYQAYTRAYR